MWTAVHLRDGHNRGGCHGRLPQDEPHIQLLQEVLVALVRGLCVASCKAKNGKNEQETDVITCDLDHPGSEDIQRRKWRLKFVLDRELQTE